MELKFKKIAPPLPPKFNTINSLTYLDGFEEAEVEDGENEEGEEEHGDEVGNEDVVARVREVCSQLRRAELGNQQLKSLLHYG